MARARLSPRLSDEAMIRLFAEHHIVQVRRRKNGEITAVKHVAWGWIDPKAYYLMQEAHAFLPVVEKVIEGGYRLKAAIWSWEITVEVLASGVKIPAGLALIAGTFALRALDEAQGNASYAILDVLALGLPFGELWLLYRGILAADQLQSAAEGALQNAGLIVRSHPLPPPTVPHL